MGKRKDFLRHIVNYILASTDVPRQVAEDIKRLVGKAEDKYKFDAFSGNPQMLAAYLRSTDFDDVIAAARSDTSGRAIKALKAILEEAMQAYADLSDVVSAIKQRLSELKDQADDRDDRASQPKDKSLATTPLNTE
ncbi:MAG: hypothetical protein ABWW70_06610 [Thermoproteota archaeon]